MKLGSKYALLDTPCNLKYKQIYWTKYLQIVENSMDALGATMPTSRQVLG